MSSVRQLGCPDVLEGTGGVGGAQAGLHTGHPGISPRGGESDTLADTIVRERFKMFRLLVGGANSGDNHIDAYFVSGFESIVCIIK